MSSISVIVPSFNERDNMEPLFEKLTNVLSGTDWELIVVDDDSPDGTADHIRKVVKNNQYKNIRVIQRQLERGLSSAVIWGVQAAHNENIVVMDGDLQHDETIIPAMIQALDDGSEIAIGSRFKNRQDDEHVEGLSSGLRQKLSKIGNKLLNFVLRLNLTDPLTGFFAVRRTDFMKIIRQSNGYGFKILFELIYFLKPKKITEIPFSFQTRVHGESKLQPVIFFDLACDYGSKLLFSIIPPRLFGFLIIGSIGAIVHFSVLYIALLFTEFAYAQTAAVSVALVFNFSLNNTLTYRENKLKGGRFVLGLLVYALASTVGIASNIGISAYLFRRNILNSFFASSVGIVYDTLWRFAIANHIWKKWLRKKNGR